VADGSDEAEERLRLCLRNDPALAWCAMRTPAMNGRSASRASAAWICQASHESRPAIRGIAQLVTAEGPGRARAAMRQLKVVEQAALAIADGTILWVGPEADWDGDAEPL